MMLELYKVPHSVLGADSPRLCMVQSMSNPIRYGCGNSYNPGEIGGVTSSKLLCLFDIIVSNNE